MEVENGRRYNFFSFPKFLFISGNISFYILIISWWSKTKVVSDFIINYLWLSSGRGKRRKKVWLQDNFFIFQIFETFGVLERDVYEQLSIILKLRCILVKSLVVKSKLQTCVCNGYNIVATYVYGHVKLYCSKVKET